MPQRTLSGAGIAVLCVDSTPTAQLETHKRAALDHYVNTHRFLWITPAYLLDHRRPRAGRECDPS